jgi:hypothetical protein
MRNCMDLSDPSLCGPPDALAPLSPGLFRISIKRMLGGHGDMFNNFPHWRYAILGNFINQVQCSSQVLDLRFEFYNLLLGAC